MLASIFDDLSRALVPLFEQISKKARCMRSIRVTKGTIVDLLQAVSPDTQTMTHSAHSHNLHALLCEARRISGGFRTLLDVADSLVSIRDSLCPSPRSHKFATNMSDSGGMYSSWSSSEMQTSSIKRYSSASSCRTGSPSSKLDECVGYFCHNLIVLDRAFSTRYASSILADWSAEASERSMCTTLQ